jgi:hypothetical protein
MIMLTDVELNANSSHYPCEETPVEGKNGFACVVERAWMSPSRMSNPKPRLERRPQSSRSNTNALF